MSEIPSTVQPKGPAADPKYPPSTLPSNPYNFTSQLLVAGALPPKTTPTHIFFFGYEGSDPLVCLQQWYPSPFNAARNPYTGDKTLVEFPTTEHYMMYHKALLMGDDEVAKRMLEDNSSHPSVAKRLGREVKKFDVELWKVKADRVVEEANWCKFSQNPELGKVLLRTGERVLVEASPDDRIWGIGFNSDDAENHMNEWGNNGLGKALMKVRDRLRDQKTW